jgi:hypothetical protein
MSLDFMSKLKGLCPNLQTLEIDLTYTDPTSYRDRDPLYDELLPSGAPTWPTTLVSITIENLRQLSAEVAEEFLASLIDSSDKLPCLRRLEVKAILKDASWRDRAELRKKWLPKLENVFLSTSQPSTWTGQHKMVKSQPLPSSQRQSTRIAHSHSQKLTHGSLQDKVDLLTHGMVVQGRCDVVNLVISDQRPAQDQFNERDFLDDEPEDDGEWNGTGNHSDGYAW